MDVRVAIDSQGDLHNNSVAHPLETCGPRLFAAADGGRGGRRPPQPQGSNKKWQGTVISTINWRTIVFLMFSMLFNHNHFNWAVLYGNFNFTIECVVFCMVFPP